MAADRGVRYFPIGLFASVMGFSGVTIATKNAENLYGWNHLGSTILLAVSSLLFLLNISIFIYRFIRYREEVKNDFNHPVKMNFYGAISISLLLLAVPFYELSVGISFALWVFGAVLQIILTLLILSKLIWQHSFKIEQFNPAWFIPIVGNIVVPLAGTFHVTQDINLFFFSVGLVFTTIYSTIFFIRVFFHAPLPEKLLPTYFILMAPFAVGTVSYVKISGQFDSFAYILYGFAFFIGLLLLFQFKRFVRIPFAIPWWAYLFPSAAMTIATIQMYVASGQSFYLWAFNVQFIGLIGLAVYLAGKTIQLAMRRSLCLKE